VRNISDISGNVTVAGESITTHHAVTGLSAAEITQLFNRLYEDINARAELPRADKEDIKAELKEIQLTVPKLPRKMKSWMRDSCHGAYAIVRGCRLIF